MVARRTENPLVGGSNPSPSKPISPSFCCKHVFGVKLKMSNLSALFCLFCTVWTLWLGFFAVNTRNPTVAVMSAVGVFFGGSFFLFLLGFEYLVFIFLQIYVGGIAVLFGCSLFFLPANLVDFARQELNLRALVFILTAKSLFIFQQAMLLPVVCSSQTLSVNNVQEIVLFADVFNFFGYIVGFLALLLLFGLLVVLGLFSNQTSKL